MTRLPKPNNLALLQQRRPGLPMISLAGGRGPGHHSTIETWEKILLLGLAIAALAAGLAIASRGLTERSEGAERGGPPTPLHPSRQR